MRALILFLVLPAFAVERGPVQVTRVSENDGNVSDPISVSATTHTWTAVYPGARRRRRLDIHLSSVDTNAGVCVSSMSTSGYACQASTPGYELTQSTPIVILSLRDEATWYIRVRGGDANKGVVKGAAFYDNRDESGQ